MVSKKRFLFVCIHNSARSQMDDAGMNFLCGELSKTTVPDFLRAY